MKITFFPFSQHEDRFNGIEFAAQVVPEIDGNVARYVAAIAIDTELCHPILHSLGHVLANTGLGIVKINNVRPIPPGCRMKLTAPIA